MTITVKSNVRHNGKSYNSGDVISDIKEKDAKRLIDLGVAFFDGEKVTNRTDYAELLDDEFTATELKEAAKEAGLEFPGNISKENLIKQIVKEGKAEQFIVIEGE